VQISDTIALAKIGWALAVVTSLVTMFAVITTIRTPQTGEAFVQYTSLHSSNECEDNGGTEKRLTWLGTAITTQR
jgi:hypothetical protein